MGAWGVLPWSNDTAADLCFDLDKKPITELIDEGLGSDDHDEALIAGFLFAQLCGNYIYPIDHIGAVKEKAVQRLTDILADTDWLDKWENPTKKKNVIECVIAMIESPESRGKNLLQIMAEQADA